LLVWIPYSRTIFNRWKHNLLVSLHAPLGEVDNDGGFNIGILEGGLFYCNMIECMWGAHDNHSIILPSSGVPWQFVEGFCTLCMYSYLQSQSWYQHLLTLNFICQTSAHIWIILHPFRRKLTTTYQGQNLTAYHPTVATQTKI